MVILQSDVFDLLNSLLSTIIGGLIAFLGTVVAQRNQSKNERSLWQNEKRLDLYVDLISLLNSIEIRIQPIYDESLSVVEMKTEIVYLKNKLFELLEFIEINNGKLLLFLPKGVYSDLIKLSGKIHAITADEQKQNIDILNFKNSEIFQVVQDAIDISGKLGKAFEK